MPSLDRRSDAIQATRGLAACAVMGLHVYETFKPPHGFGVSYGLIRAIGSSGVDIFFALSGFLIYRLATQRPKHPLPFVIARAARIYPMFWAANIAAIGAWWLGTHHFRHDSPAGWLLLASAGHPVAVAWTLAYEVYFYAVMSLCIFSGNIARAFEAWTVLEIALIIVHPNTYIADPIIIEFIAGAWAARLLDTPKAPWRLMTLGAALYAVGTAWTSLHIASVVWFVDWRVSWTRAVTLGIPAALMIAGIAALDQAGKLSTPRVLKGLGDISYSTYMLHYQVAWMVLSLELPFTAWQNRFMAWFVTIVLARATYRYIEQPFIRWGRSLGHWIAETRMAQAPIS